MWDGFEAWEDHSNSESKASGNKRSSKDPDDQI